MVSVMASFFLTGSVSPRVRKNECHASIALDLPTAGRIKVYRAALSGCSLANYLEGDVMDSHTGQDAGSNVGLSRRVVWWLALGAVLIVVLAFAFSDWQRIASMLLFGLVLLCPLMHLHHAGRHRNASSARGNATNEQRVGQQESHNE